MDKRLFQRFEPPPSSSGNAANAAVIYQKLRKQETLARETLLACHLKS
jgi:hypothetical protein